MYVNISKSKEKTDYTRIFAMRIEHSSLRPDRATGVVGFQNKT